MNPYLLIIDKISTNLIDCSQILVCSTRAADGEDSLSSWEVNISWRGMTSLDENLFTLYFDTEKDQQIAFTEITRRLMAINAQNN